MRLSQFSNSVRKPSDLSLPSQEAFALREEISHTLLQCYDLFRAQDRYLCLGPCSLPFFRISFSSFLRGQCTPLSAHLTRRRGLLRAQLLPDMTLGFILLPQLTAQD